MIVFVVGCTNLKKVIKLTNKNQFYIQENYPTVKPDWRIEGFPNYFFGDDKQLYRIVNVEKTESMQPRSRFFFIVL